MLYESSEQSFYAERSIPATAIVKEVVGVFMSKDDLQNAIRELESTSFPRQDISVMGSRSDLERVFGAKVVPPEFAIDNPDTPRQAPSRPEEQTIGAAGMIGGTAYVGAMALALTAGAVTFPAIISAAVIGGIGGGTMGAVLTKIFGNRFNRHMKEQIEKGGLLLWVRTPDHEREDLANRILITNNAYQVHMHQIV
jgi:outer membrane lipoprotein SlyB